MLSEMRTKLVARGYSVETLGVLGSNDPVAPPCIQVRRGEGDKLVVIERSGNGFLAVVGTTRGLFGTMHYRETVPEMLEFVDGAFTHA